MTALPFRQIYKSFEAELSWIPERKIPHGVYQHPGFLNLFQLASTFLPTITLGKSLSGVRKTPRYKEITVEYQDMDFKKQKKSFEGWTAQIIQHEVDHLEGIII